MKPPSLLLVTSLAVLSLQMPTRAGEPPELPRLRASYEAALQRTTKPVNETYLGELTRLRGSYTKAGKLEEALAISAEMNIIKTRLGLPTEEIAALPAEAPKPAPTSSVGGAINVTILSNTPDGYVLGAVKKGDVITLQYVSGLWKDHGFIPTASPDDPHADDGDNNRLVIALPAEKGKPGKLIKLVPPGTMITPFSFTFPTTRDKVVLRINSNSEEKKNPGQVVYRISLRRS